MAETAATPKELVLGYLTGCGVDLATVVPVPRTAPGRRAGATFWAIEFKDPVDGRGRRISFGDTEAEAWENSWERIADGSWSVAPVEEE